MQDRFSQGDAVRLSDLQEEIASLKQNSMSVTDYYTHLKILWDELSNLRPVPTCICIPQCNCNALDIIRNYNHQDYVIQFLKGLNVDFSTVKSQILIMDPLPTLNRVFALVLQHERQIRGSSDQGFNDSAVLYAEKGNFNSTYIATGSAQSAKQFPNIGSNRRPTCAFCGIYGHSIDKCYKKYGYPPGYKNNNKSYNGAVNQVESSISLHNVKVSSPGVHSDVKGK